MGLPSLPLTWRSEKIGGPTAWAIIKSRTCRHRRQVQVRPRRPLNIFILVEHGITPRYEGAAAGMGVQAIRRGSFCGVVVIRRKEIQKPSVFGGVFASFCRRGQKDVAPEREIFLWRESRKWAVGDAGPYGVRPSGCVQTSGRGRGKTPPLHGAIATDAQQRRKAPRCGAWERQREKEYMRFVVRRCPYILVFAGYRAAPCAAGRRAGSLETCGFKQTFWSLLGLRPKVTRARGRGTVPAGGMEVKGRGGAKPRPYGEIDESTPVFGGASMRAVEDAGPYGVRTAEHTGKHGGFGDAGPYGV